MPRYQSSYQKESSKPSPKANSDALRSRPFAPTPHSQDLPPASPTQANQPPEFSVLASDSERLQPIQPKLTIGTVDDKYEQAVDRIAAPVMQQTRPIAPAPQPNPAQPTIQRYVEIDKSAYELEKDNSADARAPFTRFDSDMSIQDPKPGGSNSPGIGWSKYLDDLPPLKVANDSTLAINAIEGEPKEFYATDAVIGDSNTELAKVNSPIELVAAGNTIKLPGKTLTMVQPTMKSQALPGKDEFISLTTAVCRDVAQKIMGDRAINQAVVGNKGVNISASDSTIVSGTHALAHSLTQGDVTPEAAKESMIDNQAPTDVGKAYGQGSRPGGDVEKRAKALNLNQAAWANVGQGYVTQSIFDQGNAKIDFSKADDHSNAFVWGYHYTSVVAQSENKADQIGMENYNRATSELQQAEQDLLDKLKTDFASEISSLALTGDTKNQIGQIVAALDKTTETAKQAYTRLKDLYIGKLGTYWYFRIIGQGAKQSFHEQMGESGFFVNPMTMVVGTTSINQTIKFSGNSSTLDNTLKNNVKSTAMGIKQAIQHGYAPAKVQITGYGNGWKNTGIGAEKMGFQRANAVKDELVALGVPDAILETKGAVGKSKNTADNRRVEIRVVD